MRVVLLCPLATRSGMLQRLCDLGRFDRGRCTRGASSLDSHDGRRDRQRRSRIQHNVYATSLAEAQAQIVYLGQTSPRPSPHVS
jgi:hypothetical protein